MSLFCFMDLIPLNQHAANPMVVQSNRLVESRYTLSVTEQRLVTYLLSFIRPDDEDFKEYEIKVADFMEALGLTHKDTYGKINAITKSLINRSIHIPKPNGNGFINAAWLSSADYDGGDGVVKLAFSPKLKPYLLQLKSEFTRYRLFVVVQFQSQHSIRIYMLLKQYESIGVREFDLDELKSILGIKINSYSRFQDFKNRVLQQSKKEFNKKDKRGNYLCDITFNFEPIKTGRKITGVRFTIIKQEYQENLGLDFLLDDKGIIEQIEPTNAPESAILERTRAYGIADKMAMGWLDKYGSDYLTEKLDITEEKKRDNPSGYLITAVNDDYKSKGANDHKHQQQEEAKRKIKLKQAFDKLWMENLEKQYYKDKVKTLLETLPSELLAPLKEQAINKMKEDGLYQSYRKDGEESGAFKAYYHKAVREAFAKKPSIDDLEKLKKQVPPPKKIHFSGVLLQAQIEPYLQEFATLPIGGTS